MLLVDSQRDFVGKQSLFPVLYRGNHSLRAPPFPLVALKEYKKVYEHILEMEKKLDQAKKQMVCIGWYA